MKTTRIRQSARGEQCQVRIPGHCCHNPETTVLAHVKLRGFHGTGLKPADMHAVYACHVCHDLIDGRRHAPELSGSELRILELEGMYRTQAIMLDKGLIQLMAGRRKAA